MARLFRATLVLALAALSASTFAADAPATAPATPAPGAPATASPAPAAEALMIDDTDASARQEDEAVAKLLGTKYPNLKVRRIARVPVNGATLFEFVAAGGNQGATPTAVGGYTDKAVSFVLVGGELVTDRDGKPVNLTKERMAQSMSRLLQNLPTDDTIKVVYGKGERQLKVFADPDCPACRELEKRLAAAGDQVNATVAIYPFPLSIHPNAAERTRYLLCTDNPGQAWHDWSMGPNTDQASWATFAAAHPSKESCASSADAIIQRVRSVAVLFKFAETPTLIFADGTAMAGSPDLDTLLRGLSGDFHGVPRK